MLKWYNCFYLWGSTLAEKWNNVSLPIFFQTLVYWIMHSLVKAISFKMFLEKYPLTDQTNAKYQVWTLKIYEIIAVLRRYMLSLSCCLCSNKINKENGKLKSYTIKDKLIFHRDKKFSKQITLEKNLVWSQSIIFFYLVFF